MNTLNNQEQTLKRNIETAVTYDLKDLSENDSLLEKCVRKGHRVCYTNVDNITMYRRLPESPKEGKRQSSQLNEDQLSDALDQIQSGESLYKTFNFEQKENREELEKCVTFWKSVMEKHLEPIKCTLIKCNQNRVNTSIISKIKSNMDRDRNSKKSESMPSRLSTRSKKSSVVTSESTIASAKIESNSTENLGKHELMEWIKIFDEIQQKNLLKVKMIRRARCNLCEPFEKHDDINDGNFKEEIISLNKWRGEANSQMKSNSLRQKIQRFSTLPKVKEDLNNDVEEENNEEDSLPKPVLKKSNRTCKPRNMIEIKRKNGEYSEWRRSKCKTKCTCTGEKCTCNTNPAVIKIEKMDEGGREEHFDESKSRDKSHRRSSGYGSLRKVGLQSSKSTPKNSEPKKRESEKRLNSILAPDWSIPDQYIAPTPPKPCTCNFPDCDCNDNLNKCKCGYDFCRCSKALGPTYFSSFDLCDIPFEENKQIQKEYRKIPPEKKPIPKTYRDACMQCEEEVKQNIVQEEKTKYFCVICGLYNCGCQ